MKILVIYATAGAGHRKAAEAVYNRLQSTSHQTTFVDSLDYTSAFYKAMYSGTYTFMISRMPWFWGLMFGLLDVSFLLPVVRFCRRVTNVINGRRLQDYLKKEQFDYIISTHFFPNEVAGYLKRTGAIRSTVISCVTDFDVHSIWLADGIDLYAVASGWTRDKVKGLGVPEEKIRVTGIPTDKKFSAVRDLPSLRRQLGLQEGHFTVLVATGSFGIGPIEEIIDALTGFQVIVVCGHNKSLYEKLSGQEKPLVKICGLVNNMDELMAVSDAMVTKPGGLSTSEALVSGLALIFFSAIPGQETNNIKVLKHYGLGISGCSIPEMARILENYKTSPKELKAVQERTRELARPAAVDDIIKLIQ